MIEDRDPKPFAGGEPFDPFVDDAQIMLMVADATAGLEALLAACAAADRYSDETDGDDDASGSE